MKDTKRIGILAELKLQIECLERGALPLLPVTDAPYDCGIDNGLGFVRVQVKTATPVNGREGVYRINTQRNVPQARSSGGSSCLAIPYDLAPVWWTRG